MNKSPMRLPQLNDNKDITSNYINHKDVLRSLILQLKKDFASAGIPIKLLITKKYTYEELCGVIRDAFLAQSAADMFNLLYRVDVSEHQLREGMPSPGLDVDLIAELVVKRELQKVVLRSIYSTEG